MLEVAEGRQGLSWHCVDESVCKGEGSENCDKSDEPCPKECWLQAQQLQTPHTVRETSMLSNLISGLSSRTFKQYTASICSFHKY